MRFLAESRDAMKKFPQYFKSELAKPPVADSESQFPIISAFAERLGVGMPFQPLRKRRVKPTQEVVQAQVEVISGWLADKYIYDPRTYVERYRLRIFQKMMLQSPDAKATMLLKKLSVLSDDWEVYEAPRGEGSAKQGEFIRSNLKDIEGGFNKVLDNILEGLKYGFSLSEKVFTDPYPDGKWKGLIGYKVIRDKPVFDFTINTSKTGDILGFTQFQDILGPQMIPTWKLVYWGYQASSDNPYGFSDLCPAFQHVFAQSIMDESWPTALKRYAMPILIAEKRGTAHSEESDDQLKDVFKKIKEETGVILDQQVLKDIRYLEQGGSNMAYTAYQKHQEYRARQIRLSCLVPDLAISEGLRVGSKSLGQIQIQSFVKNVIREIRREVANVVNEQIIKPLVDMNFSNVEYYPLFSFGSSERDDDEKLATILMDFMDHGVISLEEDREWLREKFGVPSENTQEGGKKNGAPTDPPRQQPDNNRPND